MLEDSVLTIEERMYKYRMGGGTKSPVGWIRVIGIDMNSLFLIYVYMYVKMYTHTCTYISVHLVAPYAE